MESPDSSGQQKDRRDFCFTLGAASTTYLINQWYSAELEPIKRGRNLYKLSWNTWAQVPIESRDSYSGIPRDSLVRNPRDSLMIPMDSWGFLRDSYSRDS